MRTFIAVEPPAQFADELAGVARSLSAAVEARYVPRENYHLTLAFLGEASEVQVRDAMTALDEAVAEARPVPLRPDGIGKFGRSHNATLWLGLAKAPELMDLADRLRDALRARGIAFDSKAFLPHITLARHAAIPQAELPPLLFPQEAEARTITLFKSTLDRRGATYKPLYTVELNEG